MPFVQGDTFALPFPDNTFDAVVSGFLVRNVVDRVAAFREMARVTKPGGRVACLETAPPTNALLGAALPALFLSHRAADRRPGRRRPPGVLLPAAQHRRVSRRPPHWRGMMEQAGLRNVFYMEQMIGTVAIHVGTKLRHASR